MGGPNLEVFKFATYVFLPILVMAHYGNPDWYQKNVLPVSALATGGGMYPRLTRGRDTVQGEDLPAGGEPREGAWTCSVAARDAARRAV